MSLVEKLPSIEDWHTFNQKQWRQLCADPALAALDYRIETNRHGQITMSPPAGFDHSNSQGSFQDRLRQLMEIPGRTLPECPISTPGGVKAADVIWISEERLQESLRENLLIIAPEICVEILSPSNTRQEIEEKCRLYFEAGAEEVWLCGLDGEIDFFHSVDQVEPDKASSLCPEFPCKIERS